MGECLARYIGRHPTAAIAAAVALIAVVAGSPGEGKADLVETCLSCHPSKASAQKETSPIGVPTLAGQHPAYIVKQLERFRIAADGDDPFRRLSVTMGHVAKELPASERLNIARKLSSQACAFHGNPDPPGVEPNACAVCHGARGISNNPDIPNLAGQDLRYMFYQYQKLREPFLPYIPGIKAPKQPNRLHPVMGPVSAELHDQVVSVMLYYSKLPCR
ncbi:MAG: hypothetical protein JJ855_17865 [Rhodospirillales bacterium]|nr:hypothetical protein [Rhodospirillales bacterium]